MRRTRRSTTILMLVAATLVALPATPGVAAKRSASKVGCDYIKTVFGSVVAGEANEAADLSKSGSDAHAYAVHQAALREAERAQGLDSPIKVKCNGKTVRVPGGTAYSKFKTDRKGKLISFNVDGTALEGRIVLGEDVPPVTVIGATVTFVSAYQSVASGGDLFVVIRVMGDPATERSVDGYDATYDGPAGRVQSSNYGGQTSLQPGVNGIAYLVFPAQPIGGTINIPISSYESDPVTYELIEGVATLVIPPA